MKAEEILNVLNLLENLKCVTRHSWSSTGRIESVAEHSWRMAVFAYLLKFDLPEMNIDRLIIMCLFHDLGEAITGDIPVFEKEKSDENVERQAVEKIIKMMGNNLNNELAKVFDELYENQTIEAKVCHALDKLECIIQHNEADIKTWLPVEYELQVMYGWEDVKCSKKLKELRQLLKKISQKKIEISKGD